MTGNGAAEFILAATDPARAIRIGVATKDADTLDLTVEEAARITGFGWNLAGRDIELGTFTAGPSLSIVASGDVSQIEGSAVSTGGDVTTVQVDASGALGLVMSGAVELVAAEAGSGFDLSFSESVRVLGTIETTSGDLRLRSDRVTLEPTATVIGSGDLLLQTHTEGRTIVLGGAPVPDDTTLIIDAVELTRLQDGFARIVIGDGSAQDVHVGVAGGSTGVVFHDDLVIDNGTGNLRILEVLTGTTLTTYAGAGATVLAADVVLSGDLEHGASLRVAGEHTLSVGGDIFIGASAGEFIAADSTIQDGTLHLVLTNQGDVTIHAEVGRGPLEAGTDYLRALTINGAGSVYFNSEVRIAGDLFIRAEDEVKFLEEVTLTNGGSLDVVARDVDTSLLNMVFRLEGGDFVIDADTVANSITILDANSVRIDGALTLSNGDLVVQTNSFSLGDGVVVSSDNNAALVIVALDPDRDVAFGVEDKNPDALSVTQDELGRLQGFSTWQLGHAIVDENGAFAPNPETTGSLYFADGGERLELELLQLFGREISMGNLDLAGDLRIDATGSVDQGAGSALLIDGATTIEAPGQNVTLANAGNDFGGTVTVSAANLQLASQGGLSTVLAVGSATVQAGSATLSGTVGGTLVVSAGVINQSGTVSVSGQTTLNGGAVALGNGGNSFGSMVVRASTFDLAGRIDGTLAVNASTMTQAAPLQVSGSSRIDAGSVNLSNPGNRFGGVMTLSAGQASVSAGGTLNVVMSTGQTTFNVGTLVMRGSAGALQVIASSVIQSGAVRVDGDTVLSAGNIALSNPANDFGGRVTVSAEQLDLVDANALDVMLAVGSAQLQSGGTLTLGGRADDLTARAGGNIGQHSAVQLGSVTLIAPGISLELAGNQFSGMLTVVTDTVAVHSAGNLMVELDVVGNARFDAAGNLVLGGAVGGSFGGTGVAGIGQFATLLVSGEASLASAGDIVLMFEDNDFAGLLELIGHNVDVFDRNDLEVRIDATGEARIGAGGSLSANGVMGEGSVLTLELAAGEDGRIRVGEIISGGMVRLLSDERPVFSRLGDDRVNIVAQEVFVEAAPHALPDIKGRLAEKLALLRPDLLKIEANRISGITDSGRLYSVVDRTSGDAYLIAVRGRDAFVYLVSVGNLADMRAMVRMQLSLAAFEVILSGGGAPVLMGQSVAPPAPALAAAASSRMDALAKYTRATAPVGARTMLSLHNLMPSLPTDSMGVGFDGGFMQSLGGLQLGFNLAPGFGASAVVNVYGDFQYWAMGERTRDMFVFDYFVEQDYAF